MSGPAQILVVCTANVCRSPIGEAILKTAVGSLPTAVVVRSAGLLSHDLPVDPLAVEVMRERGLDIAGHTPRQLTADLIESEGADLVLCMTREHVRGVVGLVPSAFGRTFTVKELARRLATYPGDDITLAALHQGRSAGSLMGDDVLDDVADPYQLGLAEHRACVEEIAASLRSVVADLPLLLPPSGSTIGG
jgi:protein-tyrosine-phosphatase